MQYKTKYKKLDKNNDFIKNKSSSQIICVGC